MTPDPTFEKAVTRLFEERFESLFRYLNRLGGDSDLAEDCAQEAFVRLFQRGAMPDDPRAWLVTVATNLFRDSRRGHQRRERLMDVQLVREIPREAPAADADVLESELRDRVREALESLPFRDRQLLLLRHEGYSYKELAGMVGVAEGSVGTLLVRATRAFQRVFTTATSASDAALD